jgi:hypothetical protein
VTTRGHRNLKPIHDLLCPSFIQVGGWVFETLIQAKYTVRAEQSHEGHAILQQQGSPCHRLFSLENQSKNRALCLLFTSSYPINGYPEAFASSFQNSWV